MAVSLREVAERAGVSVRTVSNVVSGFAMVAPETRARVQQVLDEVQYRPNAAARHLRGGRSGLIGLAVPEIISPYFAELAGQLVRQAEERSWMVLVQQTDGDAERERRLLGGVRGQTVDGLVMSPWGMSPADLRPGSDGPPVVLLGEQDAAGLFDHGAMDSVAAARDATRHLIAQGLRRIAAIGLQPHLVNGTAERRLRGYHEALAEAGIRVDEDLEEPVRRLHRADGAEAMARLLSGGAGCDAVLCFSDQLALGALHTAVQRGVRVPADLAVIGFDDIEDGRYANPSLTTVSPDKAAIAAAALDCLADRLGPQKYAGAARRITIAHRLVIRQSA